MPRSTPSMPNPPSDSSPQDSDENQQLPTPAIPGSEQETQNEETQESEPDDGWESSNEIPSSQKDNDVEQSSNAEGSEATLGNPSSNPVDRELDEALDVFDGEILSGRADIMTRANETAGENEYEERSESQERAQTGPVRPKNTNGTQPSNGPRQSPTMTTTSLPPAAPAPPDIPDAKDDDVVARQLREAALVEVDPELREKLWDEYRRYSEGK